MKVTVEAMANPHSHIREGNVVGPLIEKAIEGGVDVLGPMPNTKAGLKDAVQTLSYIDYAKKLVPAGKTLGFIPIMMLTEETPLRQDSPSHQRMRPVRSQSALPSGASGQDVPQPRR